MLLVGTTNGLWEIGTPPAPRWFWQRQRLNRVLAAKAIAALTVLADGSTIAATTDGKLWQRPAGQRWRRHTLGAPPAPEKPEAAPTTTALAIGVDACLWRGTAPASLWHASLASHAARSWQPCAALVAQREAEQWWGPLDPAAPLVTAITPDPRDARALTIAVAVGGIYHSADGGQTWRAQHRGIAPLVRHDSRGFDAHRMVLSLTRHPSFPDLLYATSESAIYRADAAHDTWHWDDINPPHARSVMELPGQIMPATHERDTLFAVLPLREDETRCTLWQTHDGGATWQEFAGAPVLPTPLPGVAPESPRAATIAVAVSRVAPERLALVTPDGDVYMNDMSTATRWHHLATGLGTVTCAGWAEA